MSCSLHHAQFCCYTPTERKGLFLATMSRKLVQRVKSMFLIFQFFFFSSCLLLIMS